MELKIETKKEIYKRFKQLGSVSFVHSEFSRRIRGLLIEDVQNAINEEKNKEVDVAT